MDTNILEEIKKAMAGAKQTMLDQHNLIIELLDEKRQFPTFEQFDGFWDTIDDDDEFKANKVYHYFANYGKLPPA